MSKVGARALPTTALIIGLAFGLFLHADRPQSAQPILAPAAVRIDHQAKLVGEPAGKLGADLMSRVGRRFVASYHDGHIEDGVTFYDRPKPYDSALCRVNVYSIRPKAITGNWPNSGQDFWDDDMTVERAYAFWTSPSAPENNDRKAMEACGAYRDFQNTFITDDERSPERGPILLDILLKIAKSGARAPFAIDCTYMDSPDPEKGRPCDSRAILRRWSLRQLRQVMTTPGEQDRNGRKHRDALIMAAPSSRDEYGIIIESWEPATYRNALPGDILQAWVTVGKNCMC